MKMRKENARLGVTFLVVEKPLDLEWKVWGGKVFTANHVSESIRKSPVLKERGIGAENDIEGVGERCYALDPTTIENDEERIAGPVGETLVEAISRESKGETEGILHFLGVRERVLLDQIQLEYDEENLFLQDLHYHYVWKPNQSSFCNGFGHKTVTNMAIGVGGNGFTASDRGAGPAVLILRWRKVIRKVV
ncbi:hypothetical protein NE237_001171 [Protea cynaroides]|uniref:Uncharacterized protein n=1 Tax=Protea cynaroides TaxID=273540 RepID=A0A9Q0QY81_9MAGN|nr:hypothetical protein NE237_001171 [Protea cynaroides]